MEAGQVLLFTGGVSCRSAAVCRRCGLPLRLCRGDLPRCVPSAMQFCCGACLRFTPAVFLATNRTACGMLRFYSAGSRSPFVRSRSVGAVICLGGFTSGLCVSLWRSRRVTGDTGLRGNGTGGAALVRFCATALALQCFPRGERWGCAPQTAPKSLRLSGLSSRCGGVMLGQIPIPAKSASAPISAPTLAKPGHTERPARL